jgi:3-mercaptopyruvate sulfurtransferase SseA
MDRFFLLSLLWAIAVAAGCTAAVPQQSAVVTASPGSSPVIETVNRPSPSDRVPRIGIEDLKKKMDGKAGYILIDNRSADEFQVDHIRGAVNITLAQILDGDYKISAGSLHSKEIILYCG